MVGEDDFGLVLASWLRQYDDITIGDFLDEEDPVFEMHVHGSEVDASYNFDAVIEFDYVDLDVEEYRVPG